MDWKTVENKISQDDQRKWDRKVPGEQLRVDKAGVLELADGGPTECYVLSDLAVSQMCQRLSIPVAYYRRIPARVKALITPNRLDSGSAR